LQAQQLKSFKQDSSFALPSPKTRKPEIKEGGEVRYESTTLQIVQNFNNGWKRPKQTENHQADVIRYPRWFSNITCWASADMSRKGYTAIVIFSN
jgi:hypothetical protein